MAFANFPADMWATPDDPMGNVSMYIRLMLDYPEKDWGYGTMQRKLKEKLSAIIAKDAWGSSSTMPAMNIRTFFKAFPGSMEYIRSYWNNSDTNACAPNGTLLKNIPSFQSYQMDQFERLMAGSRIVRTPISSLTVEKLKEELRTAKQPNQQIVIFRYVKP